MNVGDHVEHPMFLHYGTGIVREIGDHSYVLVEWEKSAESWHPIRRLRIVAPKRTE